ncbi:hypothetical protein [Lichenibacterium dinghuense]|uniref:hypothetical protein n=1 Tax=Lichenibacterium dinghuense TaxID=2895977 RepID=UPI001F2908C7|nr:hypothetical protein [Lichenibacterium sp. 6Y81]
MIEAKIKEETSGTDPAAQAVRLSKVEDGTFEVTLRYLPSRDPDSDDLSCPVTSVRHFSSRAAAEARYEDVLAWIRSLTEATRADSNFEGDGGSQVTPAREG